MNATTTERLAKAELLLMSGIIRQQIGGYALMLQGCREYFFGYFVNVEGEKNLPGLRFTAKPKTRLVHVYVLLAPSDTYTVIVRKKGTLEELYRAEDVYADSLSTIIGKLDGLI